MNDTTVFMKIDKPHEILAEQVLVLANDTSLLSLNNTAHFIWNNCSNKNYMEISKQLYAQCLNKSEISYETVLNDCKITLASLINNKLVAIKDIL